MHSNDFDQICPLWGHSNHIRNKFAYPTFPPHPFPFNSVLKIWLEWHLVGDLMHIVAIRSASRIHFLIFSFRFVNVFFFLNDFCKVVHRGVTHQWVFEPGDNKVRPVHFVFYCRSSHWGLMSMYIPLALTLVWPSWSTLSLFSLILLYFCHSVHPSPSLSFCLYSQCLGWPVNKPHKSIKSTWI